MKRSAPIIIFLLTLAFLGANCVYGVHWKSPRRGGRIKRNNARIIARAAYDLYRTRRFKGKEYILPAQERSTIEQLNRRLPKLLAERRPVSFVRFRLRNFPAKREVDAVIFDLDGTLLDSLGAWENSGANYVRSLGLEPPEGLDAKLETMSLMDGARYIKELYNLPDAPEVILEKTLEPIKNRYFYDIQPMPGVREQLARLQVQGVKMVVATASHREFAERALARLGMLDYFEFIITCDEVGIGKTSPKVYEEALKRLGVMKERTLVAEDALHALQTAHNAGFKTAAIEERHSIADRHEKQAVADYYIVDYGIGGTWVRE